MLDIEEHYFTDVEDGPNNQVGVLLFALAKRLDRRGTYFFLRRRQRFLTMFFLLLRPRGSKLSLVSKTFQDVAAL